MERNVLLGLIGLVIIIIVLLVIIRGTAVRPAVVVATPSPTPVAYATPIPTTTTAPTATPNPVIYPTANQPGRVLGTVVNKAPFDNGSYILSVETPSLQSFDVFVPPSTPIYNQRGQSMGINYLAVGQTVQVTTLPANTDFAAKSINVMNGS